LNKTTFVKTVFAGLLSGVFLGLFFNVVERITHLKVYTLLLNLDYVPVINKFYVPEPIQFMIHLIISIFIAFGFAFYFNQKTLNPFKKLILVTLLSSLIGVLLFPTTALSNQTPEITNFPALSYWLIGHGLYGFILGTMLRK
jgi:hypothetical protein